MHIQGGQVGPGTGALILMFDLHHRPDPWRLRRMAAAPRLNARLLIGGDHEVVRGQGLLLPNALVEIENPTGLGRKLRIARKIQLRWEPRANRVVVQQRQIVLPLIDATNPLRWVSAANSRRLQRASGRWARVGSSHARALTVTTTSGGKSPGTSRA